jgi:hypothetical protein
LTHCFHLTVAKVSRHNILFAVILQLVDSR